MTIRSFLPVLSSLGEVRKFIVGMHWAVKTIHGSRHSLLTSDMPVIFSNGLKKPDGHLAIPIGPRSLFIAAMTERCIRQLLSMTDKEIVSRTNTRIVVNSKKFVFAYDESQTRFIKNQVKKRNGFSVIRWLMGIPQSTEK